MTMKSVSPAKMLEHIFSLVKTLKNFGEKKETKSKIIAVVGATAASQQDVRVCGGKSNNTIFGSYSPSIISKYVFMLSRPRIAF